MDFVSRSATITGDQEQYRWDLGRRWSYGDKGVLTYVMLNPSRADALVDDATIRRCVGFADCAGYCGIDVVNLFPYRTRSPKKLAAWVKELDARDRTSLRIRSAQYAEAQAKRGDIVLAWGNHGSLYPVETAAIVKAVLPVTNRVFHLGALTDIGQPRHPLYLPSDSPWNEYVESIGRVA